MAASWPLSKKTFSQVVNGITKLIALLFNSGYDEIEAMQTSIGAPGNAQTKLAALNRLFKYMTDPVPVITWIDADTIEIAACVMAMFSGNNFVIKEKTSALQIKLSVNLDTGAEAASTWYYIYLCGDGSDSQYTAIFSASASTPTGYTYYKLIGKIYNNGSSNLIKSSIQLLPARTLGEWESKSNNTVYQAATDGFVIGYGISGSGGYNSIETDASNPPTTKRFYGYGSEAYVGIVCFVKKNDYWNAVIGSTVSLYWIPFGS